MIYLELDQYHFLFEIDNIITFEYGYYFDLDGIRIHLNVLNKKIFRLNFFNRN